jgi:hypothetical protein
LRRKWTSPYQKSYWLGDGASFAVDRADEIFGEVFKERVKDKTMMMRDEREGTKGSSDRASADVRRGLIQLESAVKPALLESIGRRRGFTLNSK